MTVSGEVWEGILQGLKDGTKDAVTEHGIAKNSTGHGHLTVTSLKMVSQVVRIDTPDAFVFTGRRELCLALDTSVYER